MTESFTDRVLREAAKRLSRHYTNGVHHLAQALVAALRHVAGAECEPDPRVHVFGGVRFVETGEVRRVQPGEWSLMPWGKPLVWDAESLCDYPILRYAPEVSDEA